MTKENAEKVYALYEQHKKIAKRLAELDSQSESELLQGLARLADDVGLKCTTEEIAAVVGSAEGQVVNLEAVAGGFGETLNEAGCPTPQSRCMFQDCK